MAAPLDRTWYNTLIDDDGSGTLGTIWNKTQVDGLLDTVDASLAGVVDRQGTPGLDMVALWVDGDTLRGDSAFGFSGVALSLGYGQLKFPWVANPSADVTTLDDYRELTWTPTLTGTGGASGVTYASQAGRVIKIGGLVCATGLITLSNKGTISGTVQIGGFPIASNQTHQASGSFGYFSGLTTAVATLGLVLSGSTADITYVPAAGGGAMGGLPPSYLSNSMNFTFSILYFAH